MLSIAQGPEPEDLSKDDGLCCCYIALDYVGWYGVVFLFIFIGSRQRCSFSKQHTMQYIS